MIEAGCDEHYPSFEDLGDPVGKNATSVVYFFEISARNWELLAWCLVGTIVAIAYFRHCSKKATSPPALPPRLVHFSPPRQDKKGVTKPLFRKKGGRQFSSSMRLNLSEQFRQCETPVSPIFGTTTRQPAKEKTINPFASPSLVVHRVLMDETLIVEILNMIKPF